MHHSRCVLQLQQAWLLSELLLAVMLKHLSEVAGDLDAQSRLGDARVSPTWLHTDKKVDAVRQSQRKHMAKK